MGSDRTSVGKDVEGEHESLNAIYQMGEKDRKDAQSEYKVELCVNGNNITFTVDTAASVSIVGENIYWKYLSDLSCVKTNMKLWSYSEQQIELLGEVTVPILYNGNSYTLPFLVITKGRKVALLGRNWLHTIRLDWKEIFAVKTERSGDAQAALENRLQRYKHLKK